MNEPQAESEKYPGPLSSGLAESAAASPTPTKGRIVHFFASGIDLVPAIVVAVHSPVTINLRLFTDGPAHASEYRTSVPHKSAIQDEGDYWDWPARN